VRVALAVADTSALPVITAEFVRMAYAEADTSPNPVMEALATNNRLANELNGVCANALIPNIIYFLKVIFSLVVYQLFYRMNLVLLA
jgi:hypothetical protein